MKKLNYALEVTNCWSHLKLENGINHRSDGKIFQSVSYKDSTCKAAHLIIK